MGKFGKVNHVSLNPLDYNVAILGESKIGKEQPLSEPILSSNGWVTMGDIKVGSKVYGEDGELHNVIAIVPRGIQDVYKVTFTDGTWTRCGKEHLWTVITKKQRENNRAFNRDNYMILSTEYMIEHGLRTSENGCYKYSVPINNVINYPEQELELDPYALGLLLGDGSFTSNSMTFTNGEKVVIDGLKNSLTDLGISYKFVPDEYKYNSVEVRREVLSGLLNTGGSVNGVKTAMLFDSVSKQLCDDVAEIARSLGFLASEHIYARKNKLHTEYRVCIMGDKENFEALHLFSKHRNKLKYADVQKVKSIVAIEPDGREECQCIKVDNPSELYLTRDFIVTHNTTLAKQVCEALAGKDGYLHFDIGREEGRFAIEGIVSEPIESWEKLEEVVDDIVENKDTDYPNLKSVILDTLDELVVLAEAESIRKYNVKHPNNKVDSINAAWGGFGKGADYAGKLILDKIWELKSVGVSVMIIGHVKRTDVIDAVTQETYSKLTADTTQKYFNLIKNKMHFIAMCYIDRDIVKQKTGRKDIVTKDDITINKTVKESRMISFRDDTYSVDSGSRFADIVDKIPFNSDAFIKAMTDAIEKESAKGMTVKEAKKLQTERDKAKEELSSENSAKAKKNHINFDRNEEIADKIKSLKESLTDSQIEVLMTKMKEFGIKSLKDTDEIPTAQMEELLKVCIE